MIDWLIVYAFIHYLQSSTSDPAGTKLIRSMRYWASLIFSSDFALENRCASGSKYRKYRTWRRQTFTFVPNNISRSGIRPKGREWCFLQWACPLTKVQLTIKWRMKSQRRNLTSPQKKQQQQINNYNVLFGFLQWEIRVVVPGESQLQQSRAI